MSTGPDMIAVPAVSDPAALLDALAAGLRRRAQEQRRAEERLAGFAFREKPAPVGSGPVGSGPAAAEPAAAEPAGPTAWRYFVARTLRMGGDLDTLRLLEVLRNGPRPLRELSAPGSSAGERVATADWIGGLAVAGFVSRELESDSIALAPLGAALLDLVAELERRLTEGGGE